jgi:hypothetical protein
MLSPSLAALCSIAHSYATEARAECALISGREDLVTLHRAMPDHVQTANLGSL